MNQWLEFFLEPMRFDFMRIALMSCLFIGVVCAIFSCFLVLKGWSLMGDAVSHAVLPGIGGAYLIGLPLGIGAILAGLTCALATGFITKNSRIKEDAAMGILFSGMFALGLVMISTIETDVHLMHILFGNVLGISQSDFVESSVIATVAALILLLRRKDFFLYCFDPAYAQAVGLPVRALHLALLVLLAMTIVSALKAAGIILVTAMLIAPGAAAFMVTRSFGSMLLVAVCVSVFSCITGVLLSYHLDAATAPLIVLIQVLIFIILAALGRTLAHQNFSRVVKP
jgi:manganese/iron transport system permease protein